VELTAGTNIQWLDIYFILNYTTVISKNLASFSFADAGLIEEYNSDFLSLKEGKRV